MQRNETEKNESKEAKCHELKTEDNHESFDIFKIIKNEMEKERID